MVHKHYLKITKKELARRVGVSRSSLYYQHKQPLIDEEVKKQIESVLTEHPSYGHKRIALNLKLNKKRILRVMKKFVIKPYRRRVKKPRKKDDEGKEQVSYKNHIQYICPIRPGVIWVSDFTYIRYQERFIYLATIMDLFTREIVGWNISRFHSKELVLGALEYALSKNKPSLIIHSDQGSEYNSLLYAKRAESAGMIVSMSKKQSPWQNAHQESFYSHFKVDIGNVQRFEHIGALIEALNQAVYYYNRRRIHTSLKMSPNEFKKKWEIQQLSIETVSKKLGT